MQRYQVYLNPQSVSAIDNVASAANVSRSKILQQTVDIVALRFLSLPVLRDANPPKGLMSASGVLKVKNKGKTDYSTRPDNLYFGV